MPTFEQQPDWWISLANLTQWFDWDALGAIGTVGAFAIAIFLARSDARRMAQRDEVILRTATILIQSPIGLARELVWKVETGADLEAEARSVLEFCDRHHFFTRIRDYDAAQLPDAVSMNSFMLAQIATQGLKDFLTGAAGGVVIPMKHVSLHVENLEASRDQLLAAAKTRQTLAGRLVKPSAS